MSAVLDPRQCWRTPDLLWKTMNDIWRFNVDAASDSESYLCTNWFGPDHECEPNRDGLSARWDICGFQTRAYCNPGFSSIAVWLEKAYREVSENIELAVVMSHVQTSAAWWREWAMKANEIYLLSPRVQFVPREGVEGNGNNRDNCLIVYRRSPAVYCSPRIVTWRWKP